jgi:hypothetical protein
LEVSQKNSHAEQTRLETRAKDLQATQADVLQQVKKLTETLAEETKHRAIAERQKGEIGQRRSELEAELTENKQAQTWCGWALEAAQKFRRTDQAGDAHQFAGSKRRFCSRSETN